LFSLIHNDCNLYIVDEGKINILFYSILFWWLYGWHDGCDGGSDSGDCLDASSDDFKCSADGGGVKSAIYDFEGKGGVSGMGCGSSESGGGWVDDPGGLKWGRGDE
jgi:hypothetical protein